MAEIGSDTWTACPEVGDSVLSVAMSDGSENTWSVSGEDSLVFDIHNMDIGEAIGVLKQIRIACDYTMTDGAAGTVYSTDLRELYAYTGDFIFGISGTFKDNTASGTFRIDTGLVSDFDKLEFRQIGFDNSPTYSFRDDSSTVTAIAEDGTLTVTYALTWETFHPESDAYLYVEYLYKDETGGIEWDSAGSVRLEVLPDSFTAPTLESVSVGSGNRIPFTVTVNDGTKYGDLTAVLQRWNGSGYGDFAGGMGAVSTVKLAKGDGTAKWDAGSSGDGLIADPAAENGFDFVRVEIGYTDAKGQEQVIDSAPMVVYKGNYVEPYEDDDHICRYVGDGFFYACFRADPELVDPEKVETIGLSVTDGDGKDILIEAEDFTYDKKTGIVSIYGEVEVDETVDETDPPVATVAVELLYADEEAGPVTVEWHGASSLELVLYLPEYVEPELISYDLVDNGSGDPKLWMPFTVKMNDAETVTATLYWSSSETGSYNVCDAASGTVTLTHDNTADPVENWTTTVSGDCLSSGVAIPDGYPGAVGWFYIVFSYTMPDGWTGNLYTANALPKYTGSFFTQWPDTTVVLLAGDGSFESYWMINSQLAPKTGGVTVCSIRLVPDGDDPAVVLPTDSAEIFNDTESGSAGVSVSATGLDINYSLSWKLELTLRYQDGQIDWTSAVTVPVLRLS